MVEHPEFHKLLLLLWEDIKDSDLPCWTAIHKSIINSWKVEFKKLKGDISVSFGYPFHLDLLMAQTEVCWAYFLHHRLVV